MRTSKRQKLFPPNPLRFHSVFQPRLPLWEAGLYSGGVCFDGGYPSPPMGGGADAYPEPPPQINTPKTEEYTGSHD